MLSILFRCLSIGFTLLALVSGHVQAQPAPFCLDGQVPTLEPALMELNEQIGGVLGDPLECLHVDPDTGDLIQHTSGGLAVLQPATNLAGFVSGDEHWQLTPQGVAYWVELTSPSDVAPPQPADATQPLTIDAVIADAATRLQVDPSLVQLLSLQAVAWSDSSLGCPQAGIAYAQVITPGYRVVVESGGQTLEYHTDQTGRAIVVCDGSPRNPGVVLVGSGAW
ncbi:MAG TPA: hypothetical protein VFG86_11775 [Chloroflexota bacterium]|nr:hypothetical protein [Chloroflexota bacterium]